MSSKTRTAELSRLKMLRADLADHRRYADTAEERAELVRRYDEVQTQIKALMA